MSTSSLHLVLILSCIIFHQCSGSKKTSEPTGNDFEKLIRKLEKDPTDERSIGLIATAYQKGQHEHLGKIEALENNQSAFAAEAIHTEYKALQQFYLSLQSVPGLINRIKPFNYSKQIEIAKNKLVKILADEADHQLKQGDRSSCRRSYVNLLKLQAYEPHNQGIPDKLRQSLQCGSLNITISDPVIDTRFSHYNAEIGNFYTNLVTTLRSDRALQFIRIESVNPLTDESIHIRFIQFGIGTVTKDNNSREVVNNQPYTSGGRRNTTGTSPSAATITTTRINSISVADIEIEIQNNTGAIMSRQEFSARHEWSNEMNTYAGDRRALSSNDRAQLRNPVKNPPADSEIVNDLLKQLTDKLVAYMQSRYTTL